MHSRRTATNSWVLRISVYQTEFSYTYKWSKNGCKWRKGQSTSPWDRDLPSNICLEQTSISACHHTGESKTLCLVKHAKESLRHGIPSSVNKIFRQKPRSFYDFETGLLSWICNQQALCKIRSGPIMTDEARQNRGGVMLHKLIF